MALPPAEGPGRRLAWIQEREGRPATPLPPRPGSPLLPGLRKGHSGWGGVCPPPPSGIHGVGLDLRLRWCSPSTAPAARGHHVKALPLRIPSHGLRDPPARAGARTPDRQRAMPAGGARRARSVSIAPSTSATTPPGAFSAQARKGVRRSDGREGRESLLRPGAEGCPAHQPIPGAGRAQQGVHRAPAPPRAARSQGAIDPASRSAAPACPPSPPPPSGRGAPPRPSLRRPGPGPWPFTHGGTPHTPLGSGVAHVHRRLPHDRATA